MKRRTYGITIILPPTGRRCDVCGRHLSELTLFGGPGDPVLGDFSGALLVKRKRRDAPFDKKVEEAWAEVQKDVPDYKDHLPWFISKHGKEKGEKFQWHGQAYASIGSSRECRDCMVLNNEEYFARISPEYAAKKRGKTGKSISLWV